MKNMGLIDRLLRVAIVLIIGVAYWLGYVSGNIALILGAVAAIFLLTSLFSTCPAYMPFGISTRGRRS
jgi:hypothetical protein